MEVKYYKEQQKNYMVIRQTDEDASASYHRKMLKVRNMEYLLKVNIRMINGETYNYYDITSKLSLRQFLGSRSLNMNDLAPLFNALKGALNEIDGYLLDPARLVLDPDMIFYDCNTVRYYFLYNVSVSVDEASDGQALLMDYLLDKADGEDDDACGLIYSLYDRYEKNALDVWGMIDAYERSSEEISPLSPSLPEENISATDSFTDESELYPNSPTAPPLPPAAGAPDRSGKIISICMTGAGAACIASCTVIRFMFRLSPDEMLILISAAAAGGVLLIAGAVMLFMKLRTQTAVSAQTQPPVTMPYDDFPDEPPQSKAVHMQDFTVAPIRSKPDNTPVTYGESGSGSAAVSSEPVSGQTVFFDEASASTGYKLYALDRKNKKHIDLDKLPITIGKLNGYVDCVIDHPTISRMHARLEMQGDKLMLLDLNSTNGVFLNGMRLSPNEQCEIEEGDEIRLGSLNYCLRRCG